jgi:hypothetical protein
MEHKQWFIKFEGTKLSLSGDGCSELERDYIVFSGNFPSMGSRKIPDTIVKSSEEVRLT